MCCRGFAERVLANGTDFFQRYHEQRGDKDVDVTQWQALPVLGEVRELRYVSPVHVSTYSPQSGD